MKKYNDYEYDFAISYAGEDIKIAEGIKKVISESYGNYKVFLAADEQSILVGKDGEKFFEDLFNNSKQIIVLFSENYKKKVWTRFEFDLILQQNNEKRFFPIKLDQVNILGLSSKIIYYQFSGNYLDIAKIAIEKLLIFEKNNDIFRDTDYQRIKKKLKNSKGALAKSVQLVRDNRQRTPLEDIDFPEGDFEPHYSIVKEEDLQYSKIIRKVIRIDLPPDMSKEEVIYNIRHCTALIFNKYKPEALSIFVYSDQASNFMGFDSKYNVAKSEFAFCGDFSRAEEGFAYNMPISEFEPKYNFEESYFNQNLKIQTGEECAKEIVDEIFADKVMEIISNSSNVKTKVLYKQVKIKNENIDKLLKKLQKEGKIKKVGPNFNWHWEIVNFNGDDLTLRTHCSNSAELSS